jgi:hypothetical protein
MKLSVETHALGVLHYSMLVAVYERVKTERRLGAFKRHDHKLLFFGKLTVPHLMLLGYEGYRDLMTLVGDRFQQYLVQTLASIMTRANVDRNTYETIDWRYKKDLLSIYVAKRPRTQPT